MVTPSRAGGGRRNPLRRLKGLDAYSCVLSWPLHKADKPFKGLLVAASQLG